MANRASQQAAADREATGAQLKRGQKVALWREQEQQARVRMQEGEYNLPGMLEKVLRNASIMETVLKVPSGD